VKRNVLLWPQYIVALVVLLLAASGLDAAIAFMDIHLKKLPLQAAGGLAFRSLPIETESWKRSRPDPPPLSAEIVDELGTDNYITRQYSSKSEDPGDFQAFELHCAYYTGMIDTVPHVPERCFVGSGGLSLDGSIGIVPIPLDLDRFPIDPFVDAEIHGNIRRGRTGRWSDAPGQYVSMPRDIESLSMSVSRYITDSGQTLYAGYFFIANGGTVPRAEQIRQLAFRHEDTYAYYAKIQFTSGTVNSAEELGQMAGSFLTEMLPDIVRRTPDWIAVKEGRYPVPDSIAHKK
jgi:hypothetical protein